MSIIINFDNNYFLISSLVFLPIICDLGIKLNELFVVLEVAGVPVLNEPEPSEVANLVGSLLLPLLLKPIRSRSVCLRLGGFDMATDIC